VEGARITISEVAAVAVALLLKGIEMT
jgi:hypothetical protein